MKLYQGGFLPGGWVGYPTRCPSWTQALEQLYALSVREIQAPNKNTKTVQVSPPVFDPKLGGFRISFDDLEEKG